MFIIRKLEITNNQIEEIVGAYIFFKAEGKICFCNHCSKAFSLHPECTSKFFFQRGRGEPFPSFDPSEREVAAQ